MVEWHLIIDFFGVNSEHLVSRMEKKTMAADMILGLIFALDTIARFWLYSFFVSELHLQGVDFLISWLLLWP